jgi:signal transduction histidine kinase/CheY-like chemotaxis protein
MTAVSNVALAVPDLTVADLPGAPDEARELRSAAAVPLSLEGRPPGVLALGSRRDRVFSREELTLLQLVADRLALALEQSRLYAAEQRARADAEAASLAKDQFLAMLAHELRNPLASIRTAVHVIRRTGAANERAAEAQRIVERQVNHLARLLDDLLDVSRITRGRIELNRAPLLLSAVINDAVEAARPLLMARRHELTVVLPPEPVVLEADATRLTQVFGNLLNNAAKFTPAGGRVRLTAEADEDAAVVRVADTGVGIASEMLPRVFDLFTQADRSLSRSEGGLGIGLTLVRSLVELHGGMVTANSEGTGRGTEFVVRLPRAAPAAVTPAPPPPPPAPLSGRYVLVVEDNPDTRRMLRAALELEGHRVEVASDGPRGLALALERRPDVAVIDIGLPGLDGYEVARRLRQKAGEMAPYLVAVTGYGQPSDRRRALDAGFDVHLVKPVDTAELARVIASAPPGAPAPAPV